MKYTLKTIKKTECYKANIEAVRAVFPGHEEDFARELMIAVNNASTFLDDDEALNGAFIWKETPQGHNSWSTLFWAIYAFEKEQNKND